MTAGLKPYPAYKDSEVEWLGQIPEGWEILLSRRFSRVFAGATPSRDEPSYWDQGEIPWLASGDVNQHRISAANQFITDAGFRASSTKWIRPGSVVVALAGQGKTKGMAALVDIPATCNQSLGVLEPSLSLCNPEFLLYYLESRYRDIRGLVGDLRDGLNLEHLKQLPVPIPPLGQQSAIIRVLNHVDLRIQRFIAAKERLAGLLEEERRAIVHHAVSKGLDPKAPLIDSGVDWIGDVPAHWSVTRVKNEFRSLNHVRRPISATDRELRKGPYDYFGASGIIDKVDSYLFDEDLLLIAEDGANLMLRNSPLAIVARGRYWVNNHAHILKPRTGQLAFMALLMESLDYQPFISGAAQPKLTQDRLFSMPIAVPPIDEQKEIVERLDSLTTPIKRTLETARRHTHLMREFRIRLISDVVTGTLDVREAAANLPDDPDADDPTLDERLEEVVAG